MMRNFLLFAVGLLLLAGCATSQESPVLVPEQSNFTETSRYDDVMEVVEYARDNASNLHYEVFGQSEQGKDLPLLIFSDEPVESPEAAHQLNRPVVFIVANIHSGEVEGKEALLRLIIELTEGEHQDWLNEVALLLAPIYNADGNDMIDRQHRANQYGPEGGVGTRPNAEGLNLNRDFTKIAALESKGLIQNILTKWDPMLFMDLHTTNGSRHGYHLTYAAPLHPDTDKRILDFQNQTMLPQLRRQMKEKGWEIFDYGNFRRGAPQNGWYTYSPLPRYSSNYYGLKNRLGLLSETYSYVDYETRIDVAEDFVKSTIGFIADHAEEVQQLRSELNEVVHSDTLQGMISYNYLENPLDFELLISDLDTVYKEDLDANMYKRMGIADTLTSKLYNGFRATETRPVPFAYALDNRSGQYDHIITNLQEHGIAVDTVSSTDQVPVQRFEISSFEQAEEPYEGKRMINLSGNFISDTISLENWMLIKTANPNRMLIFQLMEPEAPDGYAAWDMVGEDLQENSFPVVKVMNEMPFE